MACGLSKYTDVDGSSECKTCFTWRAAYGLTQGNQCVWTWVILYVGIGVPVLAWLFRKLGLWHLLEHVTKGCLPKWLHRFFFRHHPVVIQHHFHKGHGHGHGKRSGGRGRR